MLHSHMPASHVILLQPIWGPRRDGYCSGPYAYILEHPYWEAASEAIIGGALGGIQLMAEEM